MSRLTQELGAYLVAAGVLSLALSVCPAHAEMYSAGQVGVTIPNSFSHVEGINMNAGTSISNLSLTNAVMYGLKFGYYLDSMKWLGFETEIFNTTPQIKHQTVTSTGPTGSMTGTIPGGSLRVLTWAPVNVVVRYQMGKLEPYAGVGVGIFMASVNDVASGTYSPNTNFGLNTQVGLRYFVIENLSLFGEWKYNRTSFHFSGYNASPAQSTGSGYRGDYSANIFAFGIGYHFE